MSDKIYACCNDETCQYCNGTGVAFDEDVDRFMADLEKRLQTMTATPVGRPPACYPYQCFTVTRHGVFLACITAYDDGGRKFEFDNEAVYLTEDLEQLLQLSKLLDPHGDKPITL